MYRYKLALVALALVLSLAASARAQQGAVGYPAATGPTFHTTLAPPATIAGNGNWASPCLPAPLVRAYNVFVALSAVGTVSTQRYADVTTVQGATTVSGCTRPLGTAVPGSPLVLVNGAGCPSSSFCGNVAVNDGMPFSAFKITVTDTSASTNTVRVVDLMQAPE